MGVAEHRQPFLDGRPVQFIEGGCTAFAFEPPGEERDRLPVQAECVGAAPVRRGDEQKRALQILQVRGHDSRVIRRVSAVLLRNTQASPSFPLFHWSFGSLDPRRLTRHLRIVRRIRHFGAAVFARAQLPLIAGVHF